MGKVTIPQSALSRSQPFGPGPLCRCATSPHAVGSHPLHKGAFRRVRRGEQCSPGESCGDTKPRGRALLALTAAVWLRLPHWLHLRGAGTEGD